MRRCRLLRPGLVEYGRAWELQKELVSARSQNRIIDTLLVLQHPPTYTFGRRIKISPPLNPLPQGEGRHERLPIIPPPLMGDEYHSAAVYHVDRGGGATYHGPGQIIVYPILDLKNYTTDFHTYLRMLEEVMIRALAMYNIKSERRHGYTGVWVDGEKIGSIGVRIIRGITMHGFSLNVSNDLTPFDLIVPCNLEGVRMTSMARNTERVLEIREVEKRLIQNFSRVFNAVIEDAGTVCREYPVVERRDPHLVP